MGNLIYTGIGARDVPHKYVEGMRSVAMHLSKYHQYTLRSGGARGCDTVFQEGCASVNGEMQIFLPYNNFNGNRVDNKVFLCDNTNSKALEIAKHFHPAWNKLSDKGVQMMVRNVYQVLGINLDMKTDFIVCYTKNGEITGGTGQALRMAEHFDIPVFNFGKPENNSFLDFLEWFETYNINKG